MSFNEQLNKLCLKNKTYLCVGLDTDFSKIPEFLKKEKESLFLFNKEIIDATADLVCSYKPQFAYYAAQRAEDQLEKTIHYIKEKYSHIQVILDSKRGDIDATATQYAKESFERYQADAVTVNPYMGFDTIKPFADYQDKGVYVLCKTSNPSSADFQNLKVEGGEFLYQKVAMKAARDWNKNKNVGLVVGATFPEEMKSIRSLSEDLTFLVPGVGAQGGDLEKVLQMGLNKKGLGLVINSSRGIIYAGQGQDFQQKARLAAESMVLEMRKFFR